MEAANSSAEVFGKWLNEKHLLHDAVLFKLEFLKNQGEGNVSFSASALTLGLKIPIDIALGKYEIVSVVLKDVSAMDIKIPQIMDAVYLTKAEIDVGGFSRVKNANSFRLKLFGEQYLEREQKWTECQMADVSFETFEICG